jgi:trimethylamine-N-oxide reductase (cytochrome c)
MHTDPFTRRTYPMEGFSEVHMIWAAGGQTWTGSQEGGFNTQEAYRDPKIECVVVQHMLFERGMVFADIILPVAFTTEVTDVYNEESIYTDGYSTLALQRPLINPRGEAKSDYGCVLEVAKKLEFYDQVAAGKTIEDRVQLGYQNSKYQDYISWEDFNEKCYYSTSPETNWQDTRPPSESFYNDPGKSPLRTPTGLIEYESTELLENFPDDVERPPLHTLCAEVLHLKDILMMKIRSSVQEPMTILWLYAAPRVSGAIILSITMCRG